MSVGILNITLDSSMMPVATGSIVNGFNTLVDFGQAAMTLPSLVMASMCLVAGKLADRFGEERIFFTGAVILASGMAEAALSPRV